MNKRLLLLLDWRPHGQRDVVGGSTRCCRGETGRLNKYDIKNCLCKRSQGRKRFRWLALEASFLCARRCVWRESSIGWNSSSGNPLLHYFLMPDAVVPLPHDNSMAMQILCSFLTSQFQRCCMGGERIVCLGLLSRITRVRGAPGMNKVPIKPCA